MYLLNTLANPKSQSLTCPCRVMYLLHTLANPKSQSLTCPCRVMYLLHTLANPKSQSLTCPCRVMYLLNTLANPKSQSLTCPCRVMYLLNTLANLKSQSLTCPCRVMYLLTGFSLTRLDASLTHQNRPGRAVSQSGASPGSIPITPARKLQSVTLLIEGSHLTSRGVNASPICRYTWNTWDHTWENFTLAWPTFKPQPSVFTQHVPTIEKASYQYTG